MAYQAGELDQRVKILQNTVTLDELGGEQITLAEVSEKWAHVRPLRSQESFEAEKQTSKNLYLFVFRHNFQIFSENTLQWRGLNFNILSIKQPKNKALYIEIEAESGGAL